MTQQQQKQKQKQPVSNIDVSASLGNLQLPFCVYNASGPRSGTIEALQKIAASTSGAVLTKSATISPQEGNPLPRTYHAPDHMASFNSEGLPNKGIDYYIAAETRTAVLNETTTTAAAKPYIVSLSGKCLEDNLEMIRRIAAVQHSDAPTTPKIASIELNLACPNVIGKPIIGYDMDQMAQTLQQVEQVVSECRKRYHSTIVPPLGIKLPPYLDFSHFAQVTRLLNQYRDMISYVVSINTLGNALAIDGVDMETPHIRSNDGYAGLSGPAVRYTALANVRKLRAGLHESMTVVGVGGIRTGQDVYDMMLCGATVCQVATQHWKEGSVCFDRIRDELIQILQQKGHTSIQQVFNQLQPYSKERASMARQQQQQQLKQTNPTAANMNDISSSIDDVQFYKTLSIILIMALAILISYELQQRQPWSSLLLPTE